jgi:hypothetical protein
MFSISYPSGTIRQNGEMIEPGSPEFDAYVAFLQAEGTPEPLQDPPEVYPRIEVSAWQLVQALAEKGWLQQVEDAVAASTDLLVKYGWTRAPVFWSDHALSIGLGASIGKTRAELQGLFELAKSK